MSRHATPLGECDCTQTDRLVSGRHAADDPDSGWLYDYGLDVTRVRIERIGHASHLADEFGYMRPLTCAACALTIRRARETA